MRPSSPRASRSPLVMVFSASPASLRPLDLTGEIEGITVALEQMGLGERLRFMVQSSATADALQRALLSEQPTIVHFSGHGRGQELPRHGRHRAAKRDLHAADEPFPVTGLMMHGSGTTGVTIVSGEALGDLLARSGTKVRLVFLNACHSAEQAMALNQHVDFVVGIDGAIGDDAARVFAAAFYRALALGRSVRSAFELGVNALMLEGLDADVDLPKLYSRPGVDPTKASLVVSSTAFAAPTWDVFVSYAHADRGEVHQLARELHDRGLRVFFDEWEIGAGDLVARRLEEGVAASLHGLMAVSPRTLQQPWARTEYAALLYKAVEQGRRLIPVLIGKADQGGTARKAGLELPPFLRTLHYVDLRGKTGEAHRQEVDAIARAIRGLRPGPPPRRG